MKIRTSLRAGAKGCSPEAQYYMEQALAMEAKVENCKAIIITPPASTTPPVSGRPTPIRLSGYAVIQASAFIRRIQGKYVPELRSAASCYVVQSGER